MNVSMWRGRERAREQRRRHCGVREVEIMNKESKRG